MTAVDARLRLAVADASVVAPAPDLPAAFNDAGVLGPLDVRAALAIAELLGEDDATVMLAVALAVRGTRLGHVAIRLAEQRDTIVVEGADQELIDALPWPDPQQWDRALEQSPLIGPPGSGSPLISDRSLLYLQRYFDYEAAFAALTLSRVAQPIGPVARGVESQLDALLTARSDGTPSRQNVAARVALGGRLAVVAGGPGTGKTYLIARMLQALARTGDAFPRVALCAPTGKAAARLGEEIAAAADGERNDAARRRLHHVEASTIHRLLGWHPARARFRHDERNLLPHDLVVVDEMSMVSLPLAARLVSALRPDATLVLVGDPFQLESIEAGTVLADLVGPLGSGVEGEGPMAERVIVLDEVYRFDEGGVISRFADAVRRGDADEAVALLGAGHQGLEWIPDRGLPQFDRLRARVLDQRARVVDAAKTSGREEEALDALGELAVLAAHREGRHSVAAWRRDIESWLEERYVGLRDDGDWYPGRPIMITRNDPNLRLYNGDIGVAARTADGLRAVFRREELLSFPRSYLGEHEAVHALTIHKSQGSEFGEVVVSLPGETSRLLTRELLYTAVTRAADRVTIIGEEDIVRRAIARKVQRASGLEARLWGS